MRALIKLQGRNELRPGVMTSKFPKGVRPFNLENSQENRIRMFFYRKERMLAGVYCIEMIAFFSTLTFFTIPSVLPGLGESTKTEKFMKI